MFHVLNRGVGGAALFEKDMDYQAFERVMFETLPDAPMRICGYCLMPNHWHLLLWPEHDGDLARFMQRLTVTHVRRWQENRHCAGKGHVYQGRYKSFPVQDDEHFLTVARYVERNPLRAGLVQRAELWRWSSLWLRGRGSPEQKAGLAEWPVAMPGNWNSVVNAEEDERELDSLRRSVQRGRPFGLAEWQRRIAKLLGLESTYRSPGRPPIARKAGAT